MATPMLAVTPHSWPLNCKGLLTTESIARNRCNLLTFRNFVEEDMLRERGVDADHTTIYRSVRTHAREMEKGLSWYLQVTVDAAQLIDRQCE